MLNRRALLLVALGRTGAAAAGPRPSLRLAAESFPPFSFLEAGEPRGLDLEVVRPVLDGLGFDAQLSIVPWRRALLEVQQGTLDGIIGATRGDLNEREELLAFPEEPLSASFSRFYYRREQPFRFEGLFSLKGKRVAVLGGYRYPPDFTAAPYFVRQAVNTHEQCLHLLMAGRVELALVHAGVAEYVVHREGWQEKLAVDPTPIAPGQLWVGFSRRSGHEALAQRFGPALRSFKRSAAYGQLLARYGIRAETLKGVA